MSALVAYLDVVGDPVQVRQGQAVAVLQGGEGRGRDDRGVVHLCVRVKHTLCVCVGQSSMSTCTHVYSTSLH